MLKNLIKAAAARAGVLVMSARGRHDQDGLLTAHSDHFRDDPAFRAAYERGVQAGNGVDPKFEWRVHVALWAATTALHTQGDFVECGVNAGVVSSAIMQKLDWTATGRRFYLIDTFNGPVLNQFSPQEVGDERLLIAQRALNAGAYVTDLERIRANFASWENAVIVQGAVPDVLETVAFGAVAFLHLDMNCAMPEKAAFEFFWDRLSPGAVVLFDDYSYYGCDHQRDTIDAMVRARDIEILSLPTGQGLIVK